jgi:hypothetical protein
MLGSLSVRGPHRPEGSTPTAHSTFSGVVQPISVAVQAWEAQQEYERKQEAKRRAAREAEQKRLRDEAALRKKLLEAAFDGEEAEVGRRLFRQLAGKDRSPCGCGKGERAVRRLARLWEPGRRQSSTRSKRLESP